MKFIVLNNVEAEAVRGIYKPHHRCAPIFIEDDLWILHEGMKDVPEFKNVFDDKPVFVKGDDSPEDKAYDTKRVKDIEVFTKTAKKT